MQKEIRTITTTIERSMAEDGKTAFIEGYALKFNKLSEKLGWFDEILRENCLKDADMSNVVALYNHNENYPLARNTIASGEGMLELTTDAIGLHFRLTPTPTSYADDLDKNMRAGIINQCSFAFTLADDGDDWEWDEENSIWHREIKAINKLWDVSIVTTPAYPDTEAVAGRRSFELAKDARSYSADMKDKKRQLDRKRKLMIDLELLT